MNETREYLDHNAKETADSITGEIIERTADGTYRYRDVRTGAERFATANLGDDFTPGSRVRIDSVSASRGTIGSQDTILTRAPREQRGLSATTPAEERAGAGRTVILSVSPDPLIIQAGGDPGAQTFTGIGFESQPATYVSSYEGGPNPDVSDDSAPVVSDTSVAMNIVADVASPRGTFDAIVNGARARGALQILRPPPAPSYGFFVAPDTTTDEIRSVHLTFGEGTGPVVLLASSDPAGAGNTVRRLFQLDNTRYLVFFDGGDGRLATVNTFSGEITLGSVLPFPELRHRRTQIAVRGDFIYYGDAANRYVEVTIATGTVARVLIAAEATPFRASYYHPESDCLFTGNSTNVGGSRVLRRIERVSGDVSEISVDVANVVSPEVIGSDGAELYVFVTSETSSSAEPRLQHWTVGVGMTFVGESAGGFTGFTGNASLIVANGKVFVAIESMFASVTGVRAYDAAALTWETADNGSGLQRACIGALLIPEAQSPLGHDTVWLFLFKSASSELRGYVGDGSAAFATPEFVSETISSSVVLGTQYGFGWTAT